MPLVPAKCPECGGLVEVDNEKKPAYASIADNLLLLKMQFKPLIHIIKRQIITIQQIISAKVQ